jgi:hypothetical protein
VLSLGGHEASRIHRDNRWRGALSLDVPMLLPQRAEEVTE